MGHGKRSTPPCARKCGIRGYDAGKKIKGRKRHILVDTIGLLLMVVVHAADIQDRDGARLVLAKIKGRFPRLRLIGAVGGYTGKLVDWVKSVCHWVLEIVKRPDGVTGAASTLGGGADLGLAGTLSAFEQRLRGVAGNEGSDGLRGHEPPDGQAAGPSTSADDSALCSEATTHARGNLTSSASSLPRRLCVLVYLLAAPKAF